MIRVLTLALVLLSSSARAGYYFQPETIFVGRKGPCDIVTCAEAYSVTRAMTIKYNGPLFQLNNGSTTLDIGQTSTHTVDMTTWSAFCSGVASNCTISKVYSQIHTTSNDLTPINAGSTHRSTFTIEAATGFPIWISQNTTALASGGQGYAINGATDSPGTGINALGTAESVLLNAAPVQQPNGWCCGTFGTAHVFNVCCTGGTDFLIVNAWGRVGAGICSSSNTYCVGADLECLDNGGVCNNNPTLDVPFNQLDYSVNQFQGAIFTMTYDPVAVKLGLYVNGIQLESSTPYCTAGANPTCTMNAGQRIHYGGGGDFTGPGLTEAREMLISNSVLSPAQVSAITGNSKSFYSGVNFPSGPNNPTTYAAGPGDVAPGAKYYNGFRAYTAAIAAAGTQQLISVRNLTSTEICGVLVNAAGGLGNTTSCTGSSNGKSVTSFCTSIGKDFAMDCSVAGVHDQVGGVAEYAASGAAVQFTPYCINLLPCATFNASASLAATITLTVTPQPYTVVAVAERTVTSGSMYIATQETSAGNPGWQIGFDSPANSVFSITNVGPVGLGANGVADNAIHALTFIFNGASSSIIADGTTTTGVLGTDAAPVNPSIRWGNGVFSNLPLNGVIEETGLYPFGLTPTQQANLQANQRAYWGF